MKTRHAQRAELCTNSAARKLLHLMEEKQTNLAVAADVTFSRELLSLADLLGPHICMLKTHIDVVKDFDQELIVQLQYLSAKHGFLIFEDRKFADIGNTVQLQYKEGIYQIANWAHITNAHPLPGPGIIEGLRNVGLPLKRGLLLLAEMSSAGCLITPEYTEVCVNLAKQYADFVIGFITQRKLTDDPKFIHFTPGVNLCTSQDSLGQQYNTPEKVIGERGCDVMIVGRGIIKAPNPVEEAIKYKEAGWQAFGQ